MYIIRIFKESRCPLNTAQNAWRQYAREGVRNASIIVVLGMVGRIALALQGTEYLSFKGH